MKEWFKTLAPRERLLVATAAIVAAAGLFYMLIWQPLDNGIARLDQRVDSEREQVSWLSGLADEARRLRSSSRQGPVKGRNDSLLSVVDQTSRNAGLGDAVRRIQPEGDDQAAVTLEGAGFNKLLFWLHDLQQQYGVRATALTVTRGDDPGVVQARMTLKRDTA